VARLSCGRLQGQLFGNAILALLQCLRIKLYVTQRAAALTERYASADRDGLCLRELYAREVPDHHLDKSTDEHALHLLRRFGAFRPDEFQFNDTRSGRRADPCDAVILLGEVAKVAIASHSHVLILPLGSFWAMRAFIAANSLSGALLMTAPFGSEIITFMPTDLQPVQGYDQPPDLDTKKIDS
jgi:hypothetical protein